MNAPLTCISHKSWSSRQGTCQDLERSPNLTINCLLDEVLLEIFDSYRQSINPHHHHWRRNYVWLNLAHVCRRWRAVMFASSSRLDLNVVLGPEKPGHIKTILSGHLPILIDYVGCYHNCCLNGPGRVTGSTIWRMRSALKHRDRVREISLPGWDVLFENFIKATNHHFPALESLDLFIPYGRGPDIPATFLRGPDQSDLPLRCLRLHGASLPSVSGLLLSAISLTYLNLDVISDPTGFDPSQGSSLIPSLHGMQSLRSLDLFSPFDPQDFQSQHSTYSAPKNVVPLLKLTRFHYSGSTAFFSNLMSGLSAPSLQDARFELCSRFSLSRVIGDVREEFRSACVTFDFNHFHLLSSTHSGKIDPFKPSFSLEVYYISDPIISTPSTKLAMVEELTLTFASLNITECEHDFPLREFLRQFRSVKVLRVNSFVREVGLYLQQDEGIFPLLEQIELSISYSARYSDEEYQCRVADALAAFKPFASATREREGCLVKVHQCEPMPFE